MPLSESHRHRSLSGTSVSCSSRRSRERFRRARRSRERRELLHGRPAFVSELAFELLELALAAADQLELCSDMAKRFVQKPPARVRVLGLAVLAPNLGAGGLGLQQLRELLERQPQ